MISCPSHVLTPFAALWGYLKLRYNCFECISPSNFYHFSKFSKVSLYIYETKHQIIYPSEDCKALQSGNSKYGQYNTYVLSNVANILYKFIDELLTSL